ncbi:hypothetical protein EJ08DRAFT_651143 [Tothia fuscella]|uniref:Uncharacterized protein n=1 Tax=Tothia fuscella TaxID=1048955 RepID=A0A9P4NMT6_9PEZI|nr:hypothetical protein EJ08DRAFT_651143 [Tothia fuscella]
MPDNVPAGPSHTNTEDIKHQDSTRDAGQRDQHSRDCKIAAKPQNPLGTSLFPIQTGNKNHIIKSNIGGNTAPLMALVSDSTNTALNEALAQVAVLTAKLKESESRREDSESRLEEVESGLEEVESERDRLRGQLDDIQDDFADYKFKVKDQIVVNDDTKAGNAEAISHLNRRRVRLIHDEEQLDEKQEQELGKLDRTRQELDRTRKHLNEKEDRLNNGQSAPTTNIIMGSQEYIHRRKSAYDRYWQGVMRARSGVPNHDAFSTGELLWCTVVEALMDRKVQENEPNVRVRYRETETLENGAVIVWIFKERLCVFQGYTHDRPTYQMFLTYTSHGRGPHITHVNTNTVCRLVGLERGTIEDAK